MSGLVLKLEGHAQHVRTTATADGHEVFSIINFIQLVCKSKSEGYAGRLWPRLKTLPEMDGLVVDVPLRVKSPPTPYKPPVVTRVGPATTRAGLQKLLLVLDDKVHDDFRQVDDSAFTRFMAGDGSSFIEFDFSSTVPRKERQPGVTQIHYNHYNFMPPACTPNN
jgi:hypothetical protein